MLPNSILTCESRCEERAKFEGLRLVERGYADASALFTDSFFCLFFADHIFTSPCGLRP